MTPNRPLWLPLVLVGLMGASAPLTINVSPSSSASQTIFGDALPQTPAVTSDTAPVTLGVQFKSSSSGAVSAIRFFRAAASPTGYTVALYDSSGNTVATASTPSDTCQVPCWESVKFASPAPILSSIRYTAAYWTPNGSYPDDQGSMANGYSVSPLSVPPDGGVFTYGSAISFPTQTYNNSNYYVDIVFTPSNPPLSLSLSLNPTSATVACNASAGTPVSTASTTGGDGNPVTYSLAGANNNDFVMGGTGNNEVVVGPGGINQADCGKAWNVTVSASQQ